MYKEKNVDFNLLFTYKWLPLKYHGVYITNFKLRIYTEIYTYALNVTQWLLAFEPLYVFQCITFKRLITFIRLATTIESVTENISSYEPKTQVL